MSLLVKKKNANSAMPIFTYKIGKILKNNTSCSVLVYFFMKYSNFYKLILYLTNLLSLL